MNSSNDKSLLVDDIFLNMVMMAVLGMISFGFESIYATVRPKSLKNRKKRSVLRCYLSYSSLSKVMCLPILKM